MATDISDPRELAEVPRHALADFLLALADTKRFLGIRYAEWCDGAPTLEASVAASAMAQDELGHSRALLPLLRDFDVDPGIPAEVPREQYSDMAILDHPFSTWPTFVAANVLIGSALTIALQAARTSRYIPLRTRAVKILEEERFHWLHGEGWFKRLAVGLEAAPLADLAERMLPESLCWFGRPEEDALVQASILDAGPDDLRARYLTLVGPLLSQSQAAHLVRVEGGRWQYNGGMPWARFDPATRRVNERK